MEDVARDVSEEIKRYLNLLDSITITSLSWKEVLKQQMEKPKIPTEYFLEISKKINDEGLFITRRIDVDVEKGLINQKISPIIFDSHIKFLSKLWGGNVRKIKGEDVPYLSFLIFLMPIYTEIYLNRKIENFAHMKYLRSLLFLENLVGSQLVGADNLILSMLINDEWRERNMIGIATQTSLDNILFGVSLANTVKIIKETFPAYFNKLPLDIRGYEKFHSRTPETYFSWVPLVSRVLQKYGYDFRGKYRGEELTSLEDALLATTVREILWMFGIEEKNKKHYIK
ncbi:MAG: hypothetical protein QW058_02875 [Candidatus Aenigmatarchaeota archaeon]